MENVTKNNQLLIFIMYYSLFKKKIIDDENIIMKLFPENVFGIFSTIRRFHKLKSYPIDIHGCIGYWDNNFNILTKRDLYTNLLDVSYKSVWSDNRNQYFTAIETDPYSFFELDFMIKPLYKIDKTSGIISDINKPFNNNDFGIIIQSYDKTMKATYLPGVFPNITWKSLIVSIKNKATIVSDNFEVFAYKIKQLKSQFINILISDFFIYTCIHNYVRFLINNMNINLKYPFIYLCKNNKLEWNDNDDVRNIATLSDILKYISLYPNVANKTEIKKIEKKASFIYNHLDDYNSQALSFLGIIVEQQNKVNIKKVFCEKLINDLPFVETDFARPEIIIGLKKANCIFKNNEILPFLSYNLNDSIFKMNWIIQAIVTFHKKPSQLLINIVEKKIKDTILSQKNRMETNYIAVAFESLCFAYYSTGKSFLLNLLFELFFELELRKNCYNVFYSFLDNNARVDITGHVNNGLLLLLLK